MSTEGTGNESETAEEVSAEEDWRDGERFLKEVNLGASLKQRREAA